MGKKPKAKKKLKTLPAKPKNLPPQDEEDKPFDFGGIPERNLKKNLGCG